MWRPIASMTAFGLAVWAVAEALFGTDWRLEVLVGLVAPVLSANLSWVAMVRAHRGGTDRLMAAMVRAMAMKMAGFGAYVVLVFTRLDLRPVPFATSFTVGFVGLYVMEAWYLRRLLASQTRQPPA